MVTRRNVRGVGRVWPVSLLLAAGAVWGLPQPLATSTLAARATLTDDAPGGMTFEKDGADIKIKSIAPGSAAAGAGLKVGDYLYTVGGKKVGDLTVGEVMKLFADAGGAAECVFVTGAGEKTLTVNGAGGGGGNHDTPAPEPRRDPQPRREPERRRDDNRTPMPVPAQPGFNPAVNLMPNWEGAGTPDWVKPGMRISYYQAAASVMGSRYQWVEDPNGDYENKRNGKRYRRTDAGGNIGNSSASGDGVSQYDVISVDGGSVAVTASTFGINRGTNPPTLTALPCTGGFSRGAAVEGLWVHPDLLKRVQTMDLGDILVLRGPYPLNGKTYDSLSIVTQGAGYSSYTYDVETGLLISSGTSSQASTPQVYSPGENVPQGNTQLTMTRLVDMRQVTLPGLNGQNPEWARRGPTLRYHGTQNFTNPVAPAAGSMDAGVAMQVRFPEVGEDWAHYIAELQSQMPGAPTTRVDAICGPTGTYWIAPDALKGLRAGQVLDEDRVTRVQTRVADADNRLVTLVVEGPGMRTTYSYDTRSGALVEFVVEAPASGYTTKLRLDQLP